MRPMGVVVLDVLVNHGVEMMSAEDQHPVQTFTPDGSDEMFSEGVCTGCPDRGADDPDALGAEDLLEAGRELGVPVADQELDQLRTLGDLIGEIPGLLDDPGTSRMSGDSGHVDLSG